jgi:hypothetical protein
MAQRSQAFLRDLLFFLATDEPFLPSAVRTDFGKCAIVRFRLAADAAFLKFFLAAFLCFVEAISPHPIPVKKLHIRPRMNPSLYERCNCDWMKNPP